MSVSISRTQFEYIEAAFRLVREPSEFHSASRNSPIDIPPTQRYCCVVSIPGFQPDGLLPPGVHLATWTEIAVRFGNSPYRQGILSGLLDAARLLAKARCTRLYIDGSFVTDKVFPGDFDACWDANGVDLVLLDPVFLDFSTVEQHKKPGFEGNCLSPAQQQTRPEPHS